MAEYVQLVVQVDKSQLSNLQTEVNRMNGKTIDLKINSAEIEKAADGVRKISGTFQDGKLVRTVKDINLGFGETARTVEKLGKNGKVVIQQITHDLEYQKKMVQQSAEAYEKYRLEIERTKEPTALQNQINALTGVSTEFKSAEESARYFQLRGLTPLEKELNETADATKNVSKQTESLWDNFQKFARWYIVGNVFIALKRSLTDALDTLKAVDDELVTVRKVTGFDDAQIQKLKRQAFEVASAYGETADAYLESVAAFSRAGYKEQSAALAELSTKTQIVGDTTAEIANQFLLSVDAAYKYQGSIEKLSRVLDGANEIDNKYATSIEKIAQGMGIVAPVAEQMHVDVNELAAAIGTITAVTQRSGNEAARALRALFLNIVGDTKTEIEEGVTWTTGEIAGLRDVIKTYAPEAYKAAQATGSIIDPMEAIGGLAKSMEDGLLTEQKLMEMVSDIGGKLRTSQLLALIQNWDMYQSMMADYANALGSADKEVENALDSWTRKTNILKDTWAEFVSHLIDSNEIKTALDLMISFVQVLDSGVGQAIVFTGAVVGMTKAFQKLAGLGSDLAWFFKFAGTVMQNGGAGFNFLAMMTDPTIMIATAVASMAFAIKLANDQVYTYQEQAEVLKGLENEYDELANKAEELTETEKERLGVLKEQIDMAKQIAVRNWNNGQYGVVQGVGVGALGEYRSGADKTAEQVEKTVKALQDLGQAYRNGEKTASAYRSEVEKLKESLETSVEAIRLKKEVGQELTESEEKLLMYYNHMAGALLQVADATEAETAVAGDLNTTLKSQLTIYNEVSGQANILTQAMNEMEQAGGMTNETMQSLIEQFPDLQNELVLTENGWVINTQALKDHYEALLADYQLVYDNAVSAAQKIVDTEALKAAGFNTTTMSIKNQLAALAILYESKFYARRIEESGGLDTTSEIARSYSRGDSMEFKAATQYREAYQKISAAEYNLTNAKAVLGALSGGKVKTSGGSGGGGSKSASSAEADKEVDTVLEGLKEEIALEKQRLSFMEASGASLQDRIAQMRKIQDLLHKQADHLRQFEGTEKDVLSLSTEWWQVQSKIAKAIEDADDSLEKLEESIKAARDEAIKLLDEEEAAAVGPLQAQLDALEAQRDAIKDAREEEEKRLAVEEARAALENAQNERNIRQYNAATGQWEWVANEQTVASARKSVADAEQALADQELDRRISELKSRIGAIEDDYDARRDEVEEDAKAKLEGAKTIGEYKKDYAEAKARGDAAGMAAANAGANAVRERLGLDAQYADRDIAAVRGYDSGGILRGLGGIKATRADEMVLPPTMTSSLLEAERNGSFDALLNHLGIVTAAAQQYAGFGSSVSNNRIGTQHNGDAYYFNGMEITNVTENTSMGEFLMKVKTLSLYSGG